MRDFRCKSSVLLRSALIVPRDLNSLTFPAKRIVVAHEVGANAFSSFDGTQLVRIKDGQLFTDGMGAKALRVWRDPELPLVVSSQDLTNISGENLRVHPDKLIAEIVQVILSDLLIAFQQEHLLPGNWLAEIPIEIDCGEEFESFMIDPAREVIFCVPTFFGKESNEIVLQGRFGLHCLVMIPKGKTACIEFRAGEQPHQSLYKRVNISFNET